MSGGKVSGQAEERAQAGGQAVKEVFSQLLLRCTLRPLHASASHQQAQTHPSNSPCQYMYVAEAVHSSGASPG